MPTQTIAQSNCKDGVCSLSPADTRLSIIFDLEDALDMLKAKSIGQDTYPILADAIALLRTL